MNFLFVCLVCVQQGLALSGEYRWTVSSLLGFIVNEQGHQREKMDMQHIVTNCEKSPRAIGKRRE